MSELCLVNLKDYDGGFDEYDDLSRQIVKYAANNHLAAFFSSDYMSDFVEKIGMKTYFFMSDSFLYENCEFLSLDYDAYHEIDTLEKFAKKFYFIRDIVDILITNRVKTIEIYVSESDVLDGCDFDEKVSYSQTIIKDLYDVIILNNKDSHFFNSTKFIIKS